MGGFFSSVQASLRRDAPEPIKNDAVKFKNALFNNFRGLLGFVVPIAALAWQPKYGRPDITVMCMWMWMFWFFLLQPVAIPVTGLIPIFLLPMAGVMSTMETSKCYFGDTAALFILGGMVWLLLNNSGFDRRFALWILCSGDACQFSGKRLVYKCSTAAFILSMFSNRLIVTSTITQYVTGILTNLQSKYGKSDIEPNFDEMRYIVNNAIQTSSSIGSIAILHASYGTLLFKAVWSDHAPGGWEYPDIFNYLQYTAYAFPVAFLMYVLNFSYHMLLINFSTGKAMSAGAMGEIQLALQTERGKIPKKSTAHEKLSIFFIILALIVFFTRWNKYFDKGWGQYIHSIWLPTIMLQAPMIKDATVAAIFVVMLHMLPRSCHWTQFFSVDKRSELKNVKPESAILWWRFVDQNTNYGYFFVFGGAIALNVACRNSGLGLKVAMHIGTLITDKTYNQGIFIICLITCILANVMPGVAALTVFMPMALNMGQFPAALFWGARLYLSALGVGIGSSLGFAFPFLYTPAYFCHHVGKVPKMKMLKYSLGSIIICMLILWVSLCLWAPYLWDSNTWGVGYVPEAGLPVITLPTAAPGGGEGPPAEEAPEAPPEG